MKIIDLTQYKNYYFIGDPHGIDIIYNILNSYINENNMLDNSILFFCGDNGIGFDTAEETHKKLELCNEFAIKHNLHLILVRGNHDNPYFYNESNILNKSNITLVEDYTIVKTYDNNVLCIGGSISVDRTNRALNKTWWNKEEIIPINDEIENELSNLNFNIDIVCSHNCPTYEKPKNIDKYNQGEIVDNWSVWDSKLLDDNFIDRSKMNAIHEVLQAKLKNNLKYWIYGHYHNHYESIRTHPKFICLDMYYKNIVIVKKVTTKTYKTNGYFYKAGPDILDIHDESKFSNIKFIETK